MGQNLKTIWKLYLVQNTETWIVMNVSVCTEDSSDLGTFLVAGIPIGVIQSV